MAKVKMETESKRKTFLGSPAKAGTKARKVAEDSGYSVTIEDRVHVFDTDTFELTIDNLGILNEQISRISANLARVGYILGEAEHARNMRQLAQDLWEATKIQSVKDESTEAGKRRKMLTQWSQEYETSMGAIYELDRTIRILRSFRDGLFAQYELAQTLSANLRAERGTNLGSGGN